MYGMTKHDKGADDVACIATMPSLPESSDARAPFSHFESTDDHDCPGIDCPSAGDDYAVNQTASLGSQSHNDSSRRKRRYKTALETIQECEGLNFGGLSELSFQSSFEDEDENDYSGSSSCSFRSSNGTMGSKSRIILSQDSVFSMSSRVFDVSDEQLSRNSNVGLQTLYHTLVWEAEEDEDALQGHSRTPVREGADPVASAICLDRSHSTPCRPAAPSRSLTSSPDLFLTSSVAMLKYACWNHQYEKSLMEQHHCDSPGGDVKNRAGTFELSSSINSPIPRSRPPMLGAPDEPPKEAMFYSPPYGPLVDIHESTVVQDRTSDPCDDGIVIQLKPSIVNITSQHSDNDLSYDGSAEPNICHYEKGDKDLISFDGVETELPSDLSISPLMDIDFETPSSTESLSNTLQNSDDIPNSNSLLDEPNPTEELSSYSSEMNGKQMSISTTFNELLTLMTSSVGYEDKVAVSENKDISDEESINYHIHSERSLESMVTHPDIWSYKTSSTGECAQNSAPDEYKSIISKSANVYASLERNSKENTQAMLSDLISLVTRTVSQLKNTTVYDASDEPSKHPILIDAGSGLFNDCVFSDAEIILPPSRLSSSSTEGQSCESFLDLGIVYRHLRLAETKRDTSRTKLNRLMAKENELYKFLCNETQSADKEIDTQSFTDTSESTKDLVLFEKNHPSKENSLNYYKDRPSFIPYIVDTSLSFSPLCMNQVQQNSIILNKSIDITANSNIISKDSSTLSNESRYSNDVRYDVNVTSECIRDSKVKYKNLYGITEQNTSESENLTEEYSHSMTASSRCGDIMSSKMSRTSVEVSRYPQLNNTKISSHSSYSKTQLLKQTNYVINSNNRKISPIISEVKVINPRLNDFKGGISKWLKEEKYLEKHWNRTNKSTTKQEEDNHTEKQQQQNNSHQQKIQQQYQKQKEKQQRQTNIYQQLKLQEVHQQTNEHQQNRHYEQQEQNSQQQTNQQYQQQQQHNLQKTNEQRQSHQYQPQEQKLQKQSNRHDKRQQQYQRQQQNLQPQNELPQSHQHQQQQQQMQQKTNEDQQHGQYLHEEKKISQQQINKHYEQQQLKLQHQTNQRHQQQYQNNQQQKSQQQTNVHQRDQQHEQPQQQKPQEETNENQQQHAHQQLQKSSQKTNQYHVEQQLKTQKQTDQQHQQQQQNRQQQQQNPKQQTDDHEQNHQYEQQQQQNPQQQKNERHQQTNSQQQKIEHQQQNQFENQQQKKTQQQTNEHSEQQQSKSQQKTHPHHQEEQHCQTQHQVTNKHLPNQHQQLQEPQQQENKCLQQSQQSRQHMQQNTDQQTNQYPQEHYQQQQQKNPQQKRRGNIQQLQYQQQKQNEIQQTTVHQQQPQQLQKKGLNEQHRQQQQKLATPKCAADIVKKWEEEFSSSKNVALGRTSTNKSLEKHMVNNSESADTIKRAMALSAKYQDLAYECSLININIKRETSANLISNVSDRTSSLKLSSTNSLQSSDINRSLSPDAKSERGMLINNPLLLNDMNESRQLSNEPPCKHKGNVVLRELETTHPITVSNKIDRKSNSQFSSATSHSSHSIDQYKFSEPEICHQAIAKISSVISKSEKENTTDDTSKLECITTSKSKETSTEQNALTSSNKCNAFLNSLECLRKELSSNEKNVSSNCTFSNPDFPSKVQEISNRTNTLLLPKQMFDDKNTCISTMKRSGALLKQDIPNQKEIHSQKSVVSTLRDQKQTNMDMSQSIHKNECERKDKNVNVVRKTSQKKKSLFTTQLRRLNEDRTSSIESSSKRGSSYTSEKRSKVSSDKWGQGSRSRRRSRVQSANVNMGSRVLTFDEIMTWVEMSQEHIGIDTSQGDRDVGHEIFIPERNGRPTIHRFKKPHKKSPFHKSNLLKESKAHHNGLRPSLNRGKYKQNVVVSNQHSHSFNTASPVINLKRSTISTSKRSEKGILSKSVTKKKTSKGRVTKAKSKSEVNVNAVLKKLVVTVSNKSTNGSTEIKPAINSKCLFGNALLKAFLLKAKDKCEVEDRKELENETDKNNTHKKDNPFLSLFRPTPLTCETTNAISSSPLKEEVKALPNIQFGFSAPIKIQHSHDIQNQPSKTNTKSTTGFLKKFGNLSECMKNLQMGAKNMPYNTSHTQNREALLSTKLPNKQVEIKDKPASSNCDPNTRAIINSHLQHEQLDITYLQPGICQDIQRKSSKISHESMKQRNITAKGCTVPNVASSSGTPNSNTNSLSRSSTAHGHRDGGKCSILGINDTASSIGTEKYGTHNHNEGSYPTVFTHPLSKAVFELINSLSDEDTDLDKDSSFSKPVKFKSKKTESPIIAEINTDTLLASNSDTKPIKHTAKLSKSKSNNSSLTLSEKIAVLKSGVLNNKFPCVNKFTTSPSAAAPAATTSKVIDEISKLERYTYHVSDKSAPTVSPLTKQGLLPSSGRVVSSKRLPAILSDTGKKSSSSTKMPLTGLRSSVSCERPKSRPQVRVENPKRSWLARSPVPSSGAFISDTVSVCSSGSGSAKTCPSFSQRRCDDEDEVPEKPFLDHLDNSITTSVNALSRDSMMEIQDLSYRPSSWESASTDAYTNLLQPCASFGSSSSFMYSSNYRKHNNKEDMQLLPVLDSDEHMKNTKKYKLNDTLKNVKMTDISLKSNRIPCESVELGGMVFIGMDECSSVDGEATEEQFSPVSKKSYSSLLGKEDDIKLLAKKAHTEESIGSTKNRRRRDLRENIRDKVKVESDNAVNRMKCLPSLPKTIIHCDEKQSVPKITLAEGTSAPKEKPKAVTLKIKKTQNWRSSKTTTSARLEIMESNSLSGMSTNILNQIRSLGKKSTSTSSPSRHNGNKQIQKRPFLNTRKRFNCNRSANAKNGARIENLLLNLLESIIETGRSSEGGKSAPCVLASRDNNVKHVSKRKLESLLVEDCKKENEMYIEFSLPKNNNSITLVDEQSSRSNVVEKSSNMSPDANSIGLNVENSDQIHDKQTTGEDIMNKSAESQCVPDKVLPVKTNFCNDSNSLLGNNSVMANATRKMKTPIVNIEHYYDHQSQESFMIPTTDANCIIKTLIDVPHTKRTSMWLDANFGLSPSNMTLDNIGLDTNDTISEIGSYTLSECVLLCKSVQSISTIEADEWGSESLTGCKCTEKIYLNNDTNFEMSKIMTNDVKDHCKPFHLNTKESKQDFDSINEIHNCDSSDLQAQFMPYPPNMTRLKQDSSSKTLFIKLGSLKPHANKSTSDKIDELNMQYDAFLEEVINDDDEEDIDEEFQKRCVKYTVDKLAAAAEDLIITEATFSDGSINVLKDKVVVSDSKINLLSDNNSKIVLDLKTPENDNKLESTKQTVNTSGDDIRKLIEVNSSRSGTQISLAIPSSQNCSCPSNKIIFKIDNTANVVTVCMETQGSKSSKLAITDGTQEKESIEPSATEMCRSTLSRVGTLQAFSSTVMYYVDDVYISTEQGSCIETWGCSNRSENNKMVECACDLTGGYENSLSSRSLVDDDVSTHAISDASCDDDEIIIHDLASQTTLRGVLAALSHNAPMDILEDTNNDTIEGEIINNMSKSHTIQNMLHAVSGFAPTYISSEEIYNTDLYTTVDSDEVTESTVDITDNSILSMDGGTISTIWKVSFRITPFREAIVYNLATCQYVMEEWEQIHIFESTEKEEVMEEELLTDISIEQVPTLLVNDVLDLTTNEWPSFLYGEQVSVVEYDLCTRPSGEKVDNSALEEDELQRFLSREQLMEHIEEEGNPADTCDELQRFRAGARREQVLVGAGDGASTSRSLQPDEPHNLWPQVALEDIINRTGSSYNIATCHETSSLSVAVTPSVADHNAITSTMALPESLPSFRDFIRATSSTESNSTASGQDSDNEFISNMIAYTHLLSSYTRNFNHQARALNRATTTVNSDSISETNTRPSSRKQMVTMLCTLLFILVFSGLNLPIFLLETL